jgi:hypothetical protein
VSLACFVLGIFRISGIIGIVRIAVVVIRFKGVVC